MCGFIFHRFIIWFLGLFYDPSSCLRWLQYHWLSCVLSLQFPGGCKIIQMWCSISVLPFLLQCLPRWRFEGNIVKANQNLNLAVVNFLSCVCVMCVYVCVVCVSVCVCDVCICLCDVCICVMCVSVWCVYLSVWSVWCVYLCDVCICLCDVCICLCDVCIW